MFAQQHPTLDIWVSSGIPAQRASEIFRRAQIPDHRIHLDRRATDTVTNFTSLVGDFRVGLPGRSPYRHIHHVFFITSDFHMRRARAIAFFVFGSRGITPTPIPIPSTQPNESLLHVARDIGRSLVWIATGRTGASLYPQVRALLRT